jgi:hypothetical protein
MTPVIRFVRPLSGFVRPLSALGLAALAVLSSCEKVDDGASSRATGWDGSLSTVIQPGPREVFVTIEETDKVDTPCDKTQMDAHAILQKNCAFCHNIGEASQGVPPFDFVMNDDLLKVKTWPRQGQTTPLRFLIPGDPDNSVIFERAAMKRDMPPVQADPQQPLYERITYSEASVLREWILNCFQGGTVAAPSNGPAGGG